MRGFLVMACLALGACAAQPRLALPPEPVAVTGREGVLAPARLHTELVVRAFLEDAAGQRREVGGAECRLETPQYSASFRSPARVVVPYWGWGSPALDVACRAGELRGAVRRGLVRRWAEPGPWPRRRPWWDPWEPWDPWWGPDRFDRGSRVWLGLEIGGPVWDGYGGRPVAYYPDVTVVMR